LPVALTDQALTEILSILIGPVPLRRKSAAEFYDTDRGIKTQD
jgi:hypothetical protein